MASHVDLATGLLADVTAAGGDQEALKSAWAKWPAQAADLFASVQAAARVAAAQAKIAAIQAELAAAQADAGGG